MKYALVFLSFAFAATLSLAQGGAYKPGRPVTLIVPYSAGGGTDAVARLFAKELGEIWGQSVLVDNRPGGNGSIGSAVVAKASPDGHTLLLAVSSIAINPYIIAKLPYDTKTDFTPITPLARPVVVMVASPALKANDVKSFVELARKEPGVHTFASSEPATRLYGERLAKSANVKLVHVPYKGAGQWMTDLAGNVIDTGFTSITSAQTMTKDGRTKILGIATARRSELLPNVATFYEQGVDLESKSWYGLFGPGHMAPATVNAIHADVMTVIGKPAIRARLIALGAELGGEAPNAFSKRFYRDLADYAEITRMLGIKAE